MYQEKNRVTHSKNHLFVLYLLFSMQANLYPVGIRPKKKQHKSEKTFRGINASYRPTEKTQQQTCAFTLSCNDLFCSLL